MTAPSLRLAAASIAQTDALYRQHSRTVAQICRALLRDYAEAEDATQQVFLSAHRALLHGAAPREPAAWLATIARNECRARIRTRMSTPLGSPDGSQDRAAPDPSAVAIQRAELEALWQALAELPRTQRDAVLLREIRGLSYEQLAEQLELSRPSVRSLLGRARQRLRLRLRDIHSSLGGVPWLETLARLFTGGGSPVAGKAVALGLGAAAITGGAVVSPEVLEHHVPPVVAPQVRAHRSPSAHARRRVASLPVAVAVRKPLEVGRLEHTRSDRDRSGGHHPGSAVRSRDDGGTIDGSSALASGDGGTKTVSSGDGGSAGGGGSGGTDDGSSTTSSGDSTNVLSSGDGVSGGGGDSGVLDGSGDSGGSGRD